MIYGMRINTDKAIFLSYMILNQKNSKYLLLSNLSYMAIKKLKAFEP